MDDIYKVFGGVVVGFILSPLSELIKSRISSMQLRTRLLKKVRIHQKILEQAILTTDKTITQRELFIENPFINKGPFIIPNLHFPDIEPNLEGAYDALSEFRRERLQILVSQSLHLKDLKLKIVRIMEQGRDELLSSKFGSLSEIRQKEAEQHKSIIRTEKGVLVTALNAYINVAMIITGVADSKSDSELLSDQIKSFNLNSKDIQNHVIR